jgi:hypothetical protein
MIEGDDRCLMVVEGGRRVTVAVTGYNGVVCLIVATMAEGVQQYC